MKLIRELNKLAKNINKDTHNVNCGGCCVVASEVAKFLHKLVPTRIVLLNSFWGGPNKDLNAIRNKVSDPLVMKEWYRNDIDFAHVIVEFDWRGKTYMFDSEGLCTDGKWKLRAHQGELTLDEALAFAASEEGWNRRFNRDQIPIIKNHVETHFNQLLQQVAT